MKDMDTQTAYTKAAAYCSRAERCIADVTRQFAKWGVEESERASLIARLAEERFIDERRFCRCFVADKFRYNRWGRIKIALSLKAKGLPQEYIEEALAGIEEQAYECLLRKLLQEKARGLKAASGYERNGKLIRFALARGFEMEAITRCLDTDESMEA